MNTGPRSSRAYAQTITRTAPKPKSSIPDMRVYRTDAYTAARPVGCAYRRPIPIPARASRPGARRSGPQRMRPGYCFGEAGRWRGRRSGEPGLGSKWSQQFPLEIPHAHRNDGRPACHTLSSLQ
jgi:hypothetical protein